IIAFDVKRARCKRDLDIVGYRCSKKERCCSVADIYIVNLFLVCLDSDSSELLM
ncbi:hypothetical protein Tco_0049909, partial [Tanacetum coccineum]